MESKESAALTFHSVLIQVALGPRENSQRLMLEESPGLHQPALPFLDNSPKMVLEL
jgi:hypothetical protein